MDVLAAHMYEPRPNAHEEVEGVPSACTRVIHKAMAKSPDDRYADAGEMLVDVERLLVAMRAAAAESMEDESESSLVVELDDSEVDAFLESVTLGTELAPGIRKTHAERPSHHSPGHSADRGVGVRREVFSVAGGEITLTYPRRIKAEDREILEEWLDLVARKVLAQVAEG